MKKLLILTLALSIFSLTSCVSSLITAPIKAAGAVTSSAVGVTKAIVTD